MEWCRLYANLSDDPRVQRAEVKGGSGWLLIQSFLYCTRAETEGFIPDTQVPMFGGKRLQARVQTLVDEGIWIAVDDGYLLDPALWTEERNLSDQAERKRQADRERMRAKRAAAKAAKESRDSHATSSATQSPTRRRDSRTVEKRRGDKPPPAPPRQPGLWPSPVPDCNEGEGGSSPHRPSDSDIASLVAELRAQRPDWSAASIRKAVTDPRCLERGWNAVRAAAHAVAADQATQQPGRLPNDGPWWANTTGAATVPKPEHCGRCDERTRLIDTGAGLARCPACHPLRRAS